MTTKRVHWGLEREIIDFEGSLPETRWGVRKMNPIRDYMSEVIINVTKELSGDSVRKGLFPKKLSEVIINVTIISFAGELEEDFVEAIMRASPLGNL